MLHGAIASFRAQKWREMDVLGGNALPFYIKILLIKTNIFYKTTAQVNLALHISVDIWSRLLVLLKLKFDGAVDFIENCIQLEFDYISLNLFKAKILVFFSSIWAIFYETGRFH